MRIPGPLAVAMTLPLHHYAAGDHCPCYCGGKLEGDTRVPQPLFPGSTTNKPYQKANSLVCPKCGYEAPEGGKL